jgi:hypothetical protein
VYAHRSPQQARAEFDAGSGAQRVLGYFESGCLVQIDTAIAHPKSSLQPGLYRLNSIWEQGSVVVTSPAGEIAPPISLSKFMTAGFRRVE